MTKNKNLLNRIGIATVTASLLCGFATPAFGASATPNGPAGVDDRVTVKNGPIPSVFEQVGDSSAISKGGFSYKPLDNDVSVNGIKENSLEIATGDPNNPTWVKYAVLNTGSEQNGSILVAGDTFYWSGNLTIGDLPVMLYRFQDDNGVYGYARMYFTKVANTEYAPTANPDSGQVKAGETVRTHPLLNDTAGLDSIWNFQSTFYVDTFKLKDPVTGEWSRNVSVDGVGNYSVGFDDTAFMEANPEFNPYSASFENYNAYIASSLFVDFTSTGLTGDIPELPYRFWNGPEPVTSNQPPSDAPVTRTNQMSEATVSVSKDIYTDENGVDQEYQVDYLIPTFCVPAQFLDASVEPVNADSALNDDWTITFTDSREGTKWEQRINDGETVSDLSAGDTFFYNFLEDNTGYEPAITVVSQENGSLVLNYHTEVADDVTYNIVPCNAQFGDPQMASSVLTYNVIPAEIPVEEIPEEPIIPDEPPVEEEIPVEEIPEEVPVEEIPVVEEEEPVLLYEEVVEAPVVEEETIVTPAVIKDGGENNVLYLVSLLAFISAGLVTAVRKFGFNK